MGRCLLRRIGYPYAPRLAPTPGVDLGLDYDPPPQFPGDLGSFLGGLGSATLGDGDLYWASRLLA